MADAIEKAGVKFQTGYFVRGGPWSTCSSSEQIDKGTFGKITRIRGSNCHSGALGGWFDGKPNDVATTGAGWPTRRWPASARFGDLGTHSLDIMIWMFGDVTEVACTLDNGTARYEACDETGEGLCGSRTARSARWRPRGTTSPTPCVLLVSGTEGHAAIINQKLYFKCKNIEGADGKQPWTNLPGRTPGRVRSVPRRDGRQTRAAGDRPRSGVSQRGDGSDVRSGATEEMDDGRVADES